MDFNQLMSLASQNKTQSRKQQGVTTRNSDGKSKESGVSQTAVQAFLAKKESEKKKKSAEEETARRARIEERLARSLGTKKAESAKATKSALTSHEGQRKPPKTNTTNDEQPSRINEKQKPSEYRASSKTPHQPSSKKSEKDRMRTSLEADSKNGDTKSKKPAERVRKSQANAKKGGGPINFKELLAAAERNKNGGPKIKLKSVLEHGRNSSKNSGSNDDESPRVKKRSSDDKFVSTGQDIKSTKHEKATVKVDSKRSTTKSRAPNGKLLPSVENSSVKQDLKRSSGLENGSREKQLASKMSSSAGAAASHGKLSNSKYNNPSSDRRPVKEGHLGQKRDRADLKRKRNPYLDEMDDFIDDGDDDDEVDDAPDVSKYIREIFGYDKSRFNDADDDLAYMDSNYSQIEKEEQKSSKIARLEDEIEQLKELADLKKQRDKLKKKSKK